MAIDRADDIGEQFPSDAAFTSVANPIDNRSQVDYSTGIKDISVDLEQTNDPQISVGSGSGAVGSQVRRGRLKAVNADTLTVAELDEDDTEGDLFIVAKNFKARQTVFDGQTINGITYTYTDSITRSADDGDDAEIQKIIPTYIVDFDEIIFAELQAPVANASYIDLNADGRIWAKTGVV